MSDNNENEVPFPNLSAATVRALADLFKAAAGKRREELGLTAGSFAIDDVVTVRAHGVLTVAKSNPTALVPQSAKPWNIVHLLLSELNKERSALGKAGIDIDKVVELAEAVDPELAKKAKKAADDKVAAIKEPTRKHKWGGVSAKGATLEMVGSVDIRAIGAKAEEVG
jgi:hypothetical protein